MTGTDLVHVPTGHVSFIGGPRRPLDSPFPSVAYDPPASTLDPRVEACTDHYVACDCREACMAEDRSEIRSEFRAIHQAFDMVLAGHPTRTDGDARPCQCSGCQIARIAHIYPKDGFQ